MLLDCWLTGEGVFYMCMYVVYYVVCMCGCTHVRVEVRGWHPVSFLIALHFTKSLTEPEANIQLDSLASSYPWDPPSQPPGHWDDFFCGLLQSPTISRLLGIQTLTHPPHTHTHTFFCKHFTNSASLLPATGVLLCFALLCFAGSGCFVLFETISCCPGWPQPY